MKENISYRNINEQNSNENAKVFGRFNDYGSIAVEENMDSNLDFLKKCRIKKIKNLIAIDIVIMVLIPFCIFINYILSLMDKNSFENMEAIAAIKFEANSNALAMEDILLENVSVLKTKELVEEERIIEFETKYIEDENLPLNEEVVDQEGIDGNKKVTLINTYENNEMVEELLLNEDILEEPTEKIVRVGTSKFLSDKKIHLGDLVYVTENVKLVKTTSPNAEIICEIPSSIDVKLEKMQGEYCKIKYNNCEGYINSNLLTSAQATPGIVESNRIQRLKIGLNENMALNKSSGLTLSDFKKVLSNNSSDRDGIFSVLAEDFYKADITYNVNGIFLASIGIHESAWGSSTIAKDKKNLFGYGAYDATPYESAVTFDTYYSGIEVLAKNLTKNYLNSPGAPIANGEIATGLYYNGNTAEAVNVRYASDKEWHNKVYKYMQMLYGKL